MNPEQFQAVVDNARHEQNCTSTTETPETLRAMADAEQDAARDTANSPAGSAKRSAHWAYEAELRARADELESAGKWETHDAGEFLFREWCGNSYEWGALFDVKRQRWNRLAAKKADQLGEAVDIIQSLLDLQNGCPLPKYEADFARTNERARAFLARATGGKS